MSAVSDGAPATYRPLDIGAGVRSAASRDPSKIAVRMGERALRFGDLAARMNRVGNLARSLGVEAGSNTAIVAANVPEYFEVVAGVSALGAAVATINPRQTVDELAAILEDCDARIVFTDLASSAAVRAASRVPVYVFGDAYEDVLSAASASSPGRPPDEWTTFAIPYTSGTTGRPKGVCLSHRSRVLSFLLFASVYGCFSEQDTFLVTTPLFHGGGFAFPMACLFLGGTVELMPTYSPDRLLKQFASAAHTGTFVVPTQLYGMFELSERELSTLTQHRMKSVICNAAPLPEPTKLNALRWLGEHCLHETYGSTEGGVITNLYPHEMRLKRNCAGRPIAGQHVTLLTQDGEPVGAGEIGELFSNGPTLFNGYWNRPDETAASLRDGWFSAGDLARRDDQGYIHIVDRKKDMIITGGVNVYPRDIEDALCAFPGVAEAAVVGIPDSQWGEAVCAFVNPGIKGLDAAAIIAHCKQNLAPHKVPKSIRFVESIPRNAAGKVLKKDLRAAWKNDP